MSLRRGPILLAPVLVVALVALGACSDTVTGSPVGPVPGSNRPSLPTLPTLPSLPSLPGAGTETPQPTPSSRTSDPATLALQPCDLLTAAQVTALGSGGPGKQEDVGLARTCARNVSGSHQFSIAIFDTLGLDDVVSDTPVKPLNVGSHRAVLATGGISACAIVLGVTKTSRVDVSSAANGDTKRACRISKQVAGLVEPRVP